MLAIIQAIFGCAIVGNLVIFRHYREYLETYAKIQTIYGYAIIRILLFSTIVGIPWGLCQYMEFMIFYIVGDILESATIQGGCFSPLVRIFQNLCHYLDMWMCHHRNFVISCHCWEYTTCQYRVFLLPIIIGGISKFLSLSGQHMNISF